MPLQQILNDAVPAHDRADLLQRCIQLIEQTTWIFIPRTEHIPLLVELRNSLIQENLEEYANEIQYCIDERPRFLGSTQSFFMMNIRAKEALSASLLIAEHLNNNHLKNSLLILVRNMHLRNHIDEAARDLLREILPDINYNQSTHNHRVHQTTSESAIRLAKRYRSLIDIEGSENIISRLKSFVNCLSDNSKINQAAKRCVLRVTAAKHTFTDPQSKVTTRQLLALIFLAINDKDTLTCTTQDAQGLLIEGLYEIQRGYNLSCNGLDQGGQDRPICTRGTFNKLIEKLQAIHPDCEIQFITNNMASLKLPIIVREEAIRYLKSQASPNTAKDLREFFQLISHVKECGIEVIWDKIKDNVADTMFVEFSCLYQHDRENHSFTSIIEEGQYTELTDLSIFQEQIQKSKGYHQFCSQILRQSSIFISHEPSSEYFNEHRHDSPEDQREYEQEHSLFLPK